MVRPTVGIQNNFHETRASEAYRCVAASTTAKELTYLEMRAALVVWAVRRNVQLIAMKVTIMTQN